MSFFSDLDWNAVILGLLAMCLFAECVTLFVRVNNLKSKMEANAESIRTQERLNYEEKQNRLKMVLKESELEIKAEYEEMLLLAKKAKHEQYEKLAELMLKRDKEGKPFTFYHYMIDLTGGPCIYKRISGCGSGTEYMAVTPWGDLYPCHQFVGDEAFKLGDIWQGVTNKETQNSFAECNVYAREECRDCWARLYCSGGCAANAYHATGKVTGIYKAGCDLFKKRMECAIMVQIARTFGD